MSQIELGFENTRVLDSTGRELKHDTEDREIPKSMVTATAFTHDNYRIGWICALPLEMTAVKAMLDTIHPTLPNHPNDHNTYTLGNMGIHNVVVACIPFGVYGMTSAATVASQMLSSFRSIRFGLMVGIGGGAPQPHADLRLGDVVVSKPTESFGGVVQYDYGKTVQEGSFKRTGTLNKPPQVLLTAISNLQANYSMRPSRIPEYLSEMMARYPNTASEFAYPTQLPDQLFEAQYEHPQFEDTCERCDPSKIVDRPPRAENSPVIHYGLIASGNRVMKHAGTRDKLARELGILCFEMEAGGLMDNFPCLIVRGICDYADSHKGKQWQNYAAATAAAYGKELLSAVPSYQDCTAIRAGALLHDSTFHLSIEHHLTRQMIQLSLDKVGLAILETVKENAEEIKSKVLEISQKFGIDHYQGFSSDLPPSNKTTSSDRGGRQLEDTISPTSTGKRTPPRRKRLLRRIDQFSWFGKMVTSTHGIYAGGDLTHVYTELFIVPSPWVLGLPHRAVKLQYLRSIVARESPKFTLRPIQILPDYSPIIRSIKSHDTETAIRVLCEKAIYPSAVTTDGQNLLELVAEEILNIVFELQFKGRQPSEAIGRHKPIYSEVQILQMERTFISLRALYSYILMQRVDPGQRSMSGKSAVEFLLYITLFGSGRPFPTEIDDLLNSSLSAAEDNPFHVRTARMFGEMLHHYSEGYPKWQYNSIVERLLDGEDWTICTDDGISAANACALRFIFPFPIEQDTDYFEKWNPTKNLDDDLRRVFSRRLRIIRLLTKKINDHFWDLIERDAVEVLGVIVEDVERAMQMSLIYASPLKGLHGSKDHVSFVRRCVVDEITIMLDVGVQFLELIEDSMLDWCDEWEVLDVWVESFRRLGIPIPQKTRTKWRENRTSYSCDDIREFSFN